MGCGIQRWTVTEDRRIREVNRAYREIGFDSKLISEDDRGQEFDCKRAVESDTMMGEKQSSGGSIPLVKWI